MALDSRLQSRNFYFWKTCISIYVVMTMVLDPSQPVVVISCVHIEVQQRTGTWADFASQGPVVSEISHS